MDAGIHANSSEVVCDHLPMALPDVTSYTDPSTHAPATARGANPATSQLRGGIDLGGTKIEAIVVDDINTVLGSARHPTPTTGTPTDVATAIVAVMREAVHAAGATTQQLSGVGVGSPGTIDVRTGTVSSARNLPGWDGSFALAETLSKQLGTPIEVGNDVQVATGAEFALGAGNTYISLLGVFWGTGVGGGLILNCEEWSGRGGAGEIGHMVIREGGRRCPCGNRGCVEAYAGRAAMEARARKKIKHGHKSLLLQIMEDKGRDHFTSAVWHKAVEHGDPLAIELINEAVEALGAGIASAVNLLDVPAVVIGGGLGVRFGETYVEHIRHATEKHLFPGHQRPDIHLSRLGDLGGALGAALLIR
jgi:glucokinase